MFIFCKMYAYLMAIGLIYCLSLQAMGENWREVILDVDQEKAVLQAGEVDHLVPLKNDEVSKGRFIALYASRPSFNDSKLWILSKENHEYVVNEWISKKFEKIAQNRGRQNHKRTIKKTTAALIYSIWANTLLDVKYPKTIYFGVDGTGYYFSSYVKGIGQLEGYTWSPMKYEYPPSQMVKAGHEVSAFVEGDIDEAGLASKLEDIKQTIFEYLSGNITRQELLQNPVTSHQDSAGWK